ncbi:hypothetical protein [Acetobacter sp.]|jgi:hypothetical protein|uniref:hypothetical protein n=1 Tax=Acetobacter sp. TaxID=440 RepID=UPI0025C47AD3|nr:hypothetical protein [Acetobacter sp.]MCH4089719.1 hypothetical protein [Acetobacter sp.]MCI1298415.1 hypothetical protein [Acetobacter sp.]MCI1316370.1 hypothetical protein [Acetobacter sp.]
MQDKSLPLSFVMDARELNSLLRNASLFRRVFTFYTVTESMVPSKNALPLTLWELAGRQDASPEFLVQVTDPLKKPSPRASAFKGMAVGAVFCVPFWAGVIWFVADHIRS